MRIRKLETALQLTKNLSNMKYIYRTVLLEISIWTSISTLRYVWTLDAEPKTKENSKENHKKILENKQVKGQIEKSRRDLV